MSTVRESTPWSATTSAENALGMDSQPFTVASPRAHFVFSVFSRTTPSLVSNDSGHPAHVDRHGAEAESGDADVPQAHAPHEAGQLLRRDEALHRARQVRVGGAVAAHQRTERRYDVVEVELEGLTPDRQRRLRDLE